MAVISTFELLLKPQLPKAVTDVITELSPLSRIVLQGYFLTISNLSDKGVILTVTLVTRTPGLDPSKILTRFDVIGQDNPVSLRNDPPLPGQPVPLEGQLVKTRLSVFLNPNDTGLLLIQPDATKQDVRQAANFELRGYVELSLSASNLQQSATVLVTAEHRGTFFDGANTDPANKAALGELAYALPLASGGSLIELTRS